MTSSIFPVCSWECRGLLPRLFSLVLNSTCPPLPLVSTLFAFGFKAEDTVLGTYQNKGDVTIIYIKSLSVLFLKKIPKHIVYEDFGSFANPSVRLQCEAHVGCMYERKPSVPNTGNMLQNEAPSIPDRRSMSVASLLQLALFNRRHKRKFCISEINSALRSSAIRSRRTWWLRRTWHLSSKPHQ